jgi:protein-L-isoaspartate(D-aspartate) O-methyltransferase
MFPSAMTVVGDGELACLTWRAAEGASVRRQCAEVGVIRHGRAGTALTEHVTEAIHTWNDEHRQQAVCFEIPANRSDVSDPGRGRFFLDRPHNPITVIWH